MILKYLSRKEKIVLTTIDLINELGVNNISMKEIAKKEGVTEASLYKHFVGKEALLEAVMEYYEHFDNSIYITIQNSESDATENIFSYFKIYGEYYSNYKEITALIGAYEVLSYDSAFKEKANSMKEKKISFITRLVENAQQNQILSDEIEATGLAIILLGSFRKLIEQWRITEFEFSLLDKTEEIIGNILKAFKSLE